MRKFKIDRKPKTRNLGKRKYNLNEHFFDKITPNVAWVIGWILSDGNVSSDNYKITINLRREDQKILETIKDLLSYGGPIYKTSSNVKNKVHFGSSLQIGSKHLVKKLNALGIHSNKTLKEKFPIIKDDENILRFFIRGVFEGDGSLFKDQGGWVFQIVGTKELLSDIQKVLMKYADLNKTKLTHNIKNKNHYALRYRGKKSTNKIMDWIYTNPELCLDRKFKAYNTLKKETCEE